MAVKTNIYRDGEVWCHATWVNGEFDVADTLDATTEQEAREEVLAAYGEDDHVVLRAEDTGGEHLEKQACTPQS